MAEKDEFTYENIRQIHLKEMKNSSLTRLEPTFYEDFFSHLTNLKDDYQKLIKAAPDEAGTVMLGEEIRKLKSLINSIHERRERKIIFLAQVEARGGSPNTKNFTNVERRFYDELVPILKKARNKLDKMESNDIQPDSSGEDSTFNISQSPPESDKSKAADNIQSDSNKKQSLPVITTGEDAKGGGDDLIIVQILEDDITFQDEQARNYFLKKEDVLTLPAQYAQILVKRGAAKIIENTF
ncbi:MAG: DNA replication complex GINS family protein [Thermoplasmata archaeon]|nr:MAG: DNA replication complex GINS family protein [Thermoplasmata archaeon]